MERTMIIHNVFWTLKDNSPAARQALIDGCWKYLSVHPGILHFWAGELAADHVRPVNDRDWDVGLHVVYQDKAAHDHYHRAPAARPVRRRVPANWKTSRVFDSVASLRESPAATSEGARRKGACTMTRKIRVAIVGLGFGAEFIPIYQRHPECGNGSHLPAQPGEA